MKNLQRLHCNYADGDLSCRRFRTTMSRRLGALLALPLAMTVVIANANAAVVNYADVVQQAGLAGATAIAADPDGTRIYIAATADSALTVFNRDTDGGLDQIEVLLDGGQVDGLSGVIDIAVSPDGDHVYTVALNDQALALFERTAQGLSQTEIYRDGTGGVSGMQFPSKVAMSTDGAHIYVATRDPAGTDSIFAFAVLDASGRLGLLARYEEGIGGISGIEDASGLAMSVDGRNLYVSGSHDHSIAVFARDDDSAGAGYGRLSLVETLHDGENGIDGINGAGALALDPAGAHLYVAGAGENAVAAFARDSTTGKLAFLGAYRNGGNGITGLSNPFALSVSPDGGRLYVAGTTQNALVVLRRDPHNGLLSYIETHQNGDSGIIDGLDRVLALATSPDGAQLYSASPLEGKIGIFALATADLNLTISTGAVVAGNPIDSRLIVTNNGPGAASHIRLTNEIPAGVTVISLDPPAGAACTQSSDTIVCEIDALAAGVMAEVGARYDLAQLSRATISGSAYADQRDPDISDNTDSAEIHYNSPPIAAADSAKTMPGTTVIIEVLANDSDPDGDALTIVTNDTTSQHDGSITRNPDRTLSYIPPRGFTGTDTFHYTVSDGVGDSTAVVTVVVNTPPTARNDTATISLNTSAEILVLSNDSDADSDPLQVIAADAASAAGGTVAHNGGNSVTYTPPTGFSGSDSFAYSISDGEDTATASVTVTVQATGSGVSVDTPGEEETQGSHGGGGGVDPLLCLVLLPWVIVRHARRLARENLWSQLRVADIRRPLRVLRSYPAQTSRSPRWPRRPEVFHSSSSRACHTRATLSRSTGLTT